MTTQQPQYPQVYPAPPKPRGHGLRLTLLILAVAMLCGFGGVMIGVVFASPEATSSATEAPAVDEPGAPESASVGAAKPAKPPAPTVDDGVWVVGDDMPAGTYKVTAAVSSRCYWEISKTGGSGVMDIVANDLPGGGKPQVSLKRGQTFKTDNCGTWRKV